MLWELLDRINTAFRTEGPLYEYFGRQNSNSYAGTLLWMLGIDVTDYLDAVKPEAVSGIFSDFPGASTNLLTEGTFAGFSVTFDMNLSATSDNDILRTGNGADTLVGGAGNDFLATGFGADFLVGDQGDDTLLGGGDTDTVDYSGAVENSATPTGGITVDLGVVDHTVLVGYVQDSWGGSDYLNSIERLIATDHDDVVRLTGDAVDFFVSADAQPYLDGRGNSDQGDLLDFSDLNADPGLSITWAGNGTITFGLNGGAG
jgi:Ca2+-binding RTX toxin-like protein